MATQRDEVLKQVRRWMRYGDDDLRLARQALSMKASPHKLAAFHAQQCAEKYLKAFLIECGVDFAYSHNISYLLEISADHAPWGDVLDEADCLTRFAVTLRYPAGDQRVTRGEVERAVSLAGQVRLVIRRAMRDRSVLPARTGQQRKKK